MCVLLLISRAAYARSITPRGLRVSGEGVSCLPLFGKLRAREYMWAITRDG